MHQFIRSLYLGGEPVSVADVFASVCRDVAERKLLEDNPTVRSGLAERLGNVVIQKLPEAQHPIARERLYQTIDSDLVRSLGR